MVRVTAFVAALIPWNITFDVRLIDWNRPMDARQTRLTSLWEMLGP